MPLLAPIAEFVANLPHPDGPLDPVAMRAFDESHVAPLADRIALHDVSDTVAHTAAGEVPVRIYTPTDAAAHGVLIYLHGGAFFLGSLNTHDHVARALAKESGLKVISVGYRLAPEAAFPAGLDDSFGVVRWAHENAADLGWDGGTFALAGDSSGGTFVAAIAAQATADNFDAITHQVLFYPSVDLDFDVDRYASLRENAVGYGMETAGLKPFNSFYLASGAEPADPRVSPIKREDLSGQAKALIITAEFDPLRDEGELYGQRLQAAGVETTVSRYDSVGHGFVQHFSWLPECYRAIVQAAEFVQ